MVEDLTGHVIENRYKIIRELGRGSFGRTHLADTGTEMVVLKESWAYLDNKELDAREMLRHEAEMLKEFGEIEHIPTLKNFIPGVAGESQWLVLEYIDGLTIADALKPFSAEIGSEDHLVTICQWAIDLASTLSFLHGFRPNAIIHCDINPWNVMLRKNGKLALIDFGIARSLPTDQSALENDELSQRIGAMGYPGFVAPEIFDLVIYPGLDIFSAGVMLNYWLTGELPKQKDEKDHFPRSPIPDKRNDPLWDGLVDVSEKARAIDKTQRYQTAAEMEQDLRLLLADPSESEKQPIPCSVCGFQMRGTHNFCPSCGTALNTDESDLSAAGRIAINRGQDFALIQNEILNSAREDDYASLNRFEVFQQLRRAQQDPGFSELISLPYLPRVEEMDHQTQAAKTALGQMKGFCLLADEVGLGKTIEAGIILKELTLRNLVSRILIVASTPQMALQWQQELFEKFEVFFPVFGRDVDYSLAWNCDRVITSYQIAENRFHRTAIENSPYELVIMDEAHHLISSDAHDQRQSRILKEFAEKLGASASYFLMLSATPFHNNLKELHTLLWLLKPGSVDEYSEFEKRYVNPDDPYSPNNVEELREKLSSVMIRNFRREVKHLNFPRRNAADLSIEVAPEHKKLFDEFRGFVQQRIWKAAVNRGAGDDMNRDFRVALQRIVESFHSSAYAYRNACESFLDSFKGLLKSQRYSGLPEKLRQFGRRMSEELFEGKIERTYRLLRDHQHQGKFLIFTQYPDTAEVLYEKLAGREGMAIELYPTEEDDDGSATMAVLERFKRTSRAMICSENAAEGLNLQKDADSMINFDLPWDPMKLEQRIGRIQRLGQTSEHINIFNLFFKDTVEHDIHEILVRKLRLFEATVGKVEDMLGNMIGEDQFQLQMLDLFVHRGDVEKEIEFEDHLDETLGAKAANKENAGKAMSLIFAGVDDEDDALAEEQRPMESLFRRCRSCGETLEPNAPLCDACGVEFTVLGGDELDDDEASIEDISSIKMDEAAAVFCDQCGGLAEFISGNTYFCEACNRNLTSSEEESEGGSSSLNAPRGNPTCNSCGETLDVGAILCEYCGGEDLS